MSCCCTITYFNLSLSRLDALFFKLLCLVWMILCAISQSTYFAVCYSGSLCFVLYGIKLSEECAKYCRKTALTYTCLAWVVYVMNQLFMLYSMFFTGGHLDVILPPFNTYMNVSNMLIPRIAMYLFSTYLNAAWIFPQAMGFMLATIFTHQYQQLGEAFDKALHRCDERRVSDSDIEMFRQRHQDISMHLSQADDFLMFHNAGAFCCQLFTVILLLYVLIFFPSSTTDSVVLTLNIFWLFCASTGLSLTTAGGIMVNHYVSVDPNSVLCFRVMFMTRNSQTFIVTLRCPS